PINTLPLPRLFTRLNDDATLDTLINLAKREDLGPSFSSPSGGGRVGGRRDTAHADQSAGDITSELSIAPQTQSTASFRSRKPGRLAGAILLPRIAQHYDPRLRITSHADDGDALSPGQTIATVAGPLRSILAAERVMLNFLTHLSGIATLTDRYVRAVAGTKAKIHDTRKTIPGFRGLAKYAVRCGGGFCHRIGLYDAVLVKDNHIAPGSLGSAGLGDHIRRVIAAARQRTPAPDFIEVEVDTLDQLEQVLPLGCDIVLLDNMPPPPEVGLREAVAMRDRIAPNVMLEASGGVSLDTVSIIAHTGVDRIAVGALTHSAPALDIGLDIL
ncbi:MAG: carboxylating nicotinate-nucleotide diphosphorylase, partial [Phycisphaerales bacterium]